MKTITYKKKKPDTEAAFCRICYLQGTGRGSPHLSMEADKPEAAAAAIAAMISEYAKRTGLCPEDALYEIEREMRQAEGTA